MQDQSHNLSEAEIEEIFRHWDTSKPVSIKKVETGLLNQTYIIRTAEELFILQKLHPAVAIDACTVNYFHVTQYLFSLSQISQLVYEQKSGALWLDIDGARWRLLKGVEGDVYTVTPNATTAFEAGKLLASFHSSLFEFSEPILPSLPMFQYKQVLAKLLSYEADFVKTNNQQVIEAFNLLKDNFPKQMLPDNLPKQIIHTDPKISNFLFDKNGKGICMIDFDTIQELSPLYDIGDCVRSLCGKQEDDPNNYFDFEKYQAIIKGYNSVSHRLTQVEQDLIPQACQLIMLGLASRFLNDYINDNYFGWDEGKYPDRKAHNLARAIGQISLWKSFTK